LASGAPVFGNQDAIAQRSSPGLASPTVQTVTLLSTPPRDTCIRCKPTHPSPSPLILTPAQRVIRISAKTDDLAKSGSARPAQAQPRTAHSWVSLHQNEIGPGFVQAAVGLTNKTVALPVVGPPSSVVCPPNFQLTCALGSRKVHRPWRPLPSGQSSGATTGQLRGPDLMGHCTGDGVWRICSS
jgi:hypothetical protein